MDVDDIVYTLEIVKCGFNLTKASQKMYISQPALTKIIKKLESELGCEIFTREKNKISGLTDDGVVIMGAMSEMLDTYLGMLSSIHSRRLRSLPVVTVGIVSVIYEILFREIMHSIVKCNTNIQTQQFQASWSTLLSLLHENRIDFLIHIDAMDRPAGDRDLVSESLHSSTYALFCHKDHELAGLERVSFERLAQYPLAIPPEGTVTHKLMMQRFERLGVMPEIARLSMSNEVLIDSTFDKRTVAVLPRVLCLGYPRKEDIRIVPLEEEIPWELRVTYHKDKLSQPAADIKDQIVRLFNEAMTATQ